MATIFATFDAASVILAKSTKHAFYTIKGQSLDTNAPPPPGKWTVTVKAPGGETATVIVTIDAPSPPPPPAPPPPAPPPPSSSPAISVDGGTKEVLPGGAPLSIAVANGPGNRRDWVAIANPSDSSVLAWNYLTGTRNLPATGMTAATVTTLSAPTPKVDSAYEARFYANDSWTLLARTTFQVRGGAVSPPPAPPPPNSPPPAPPPPPLPAQAAITVLPALPSIPDTTPKGATVAMFTVDMSDGSPFTGTVKFGAPNFDSNGTFALSALVRHSDGSASGTIIVNPNGPGVGPNAQTITDHVTLETVP